MIRRAIDVLFSSAVLVLFAPLFAAIAVAIRRDSRGPAIYKASRVGKDGVRFQMFKFRSMVADADLTGPSITSAADHRITPVGRFLRATKLDEFPQFYNVLRGDMTLIGPRPESPDIVAHYTPEQRIVLSVKPGVTSPGAISCSVDDSMAIPTGDSADRYYVDHILERRLSMDAAYFRHRSAAADLALIAKTLGVMFRAILGKTA